MEENGVGYHNGFDKNLRALEVKQKQAEDKGDYVDAFGKALEIQLASGNPYPVAVGAVKREFELKMDPTLYKELLTLTV